MKFFAPTGVGLYEFRVFDGDYHVPDEDEDEPEPVVIGRSGLLRVDVRTSLSLYHFIEGGVVRDACDCFVHVCKRSVFVLVRHVLHG